MKPNELVGSWSFSRGEKKYERKNRLPSKRLTHFHEPHLPIRDDDESEDKTRENLSERVLAGQESFESVYGQIAGR